MRKLIATAAAAILLAGAAVGCNANDDKSPSVPSSTKDAVPANDDITRAAMRITWDDTSEGDRDTLCKALGVFGPDWVRGQLSSSDDGSSPIDWTEATEYLKDLCAER
jgi:hypothetical protein